MNESLPPKPAPADPFRLLFVGTHGHVAALDKFTGQEVWRQSLAHTGYSIVSLLIEEGVLYAASKGHVFALNPANGEIYWQNQLPGLGHDHACLSTLRQSLDSGAQPIAGVAKIEDAARHAAT